MAIENQENILTDPDAIFRGISFPFRRGESEIPAAAIDDELIADTLAQLILTGPGERVMRPELGAGTTTFIFETNEEALAALIKTTISAVIGKFESRVALTGIDVFRTNASKTDNQNKDSVIITVSYVVPATQESNTVSIQVGLNQGVVG